jgi:restriction system protein
MIPDYQTLMRPVLECAAAGETRIGDAVEHLAEATRRGFFRITARGQAALADPTATINNAYLDQFKEFQDFKTRVNQGDGSSDAAPVQAPAPLGDETPDEALRRAHAAITGALAADLLDRVRKATLAPAQSGTSSVRSALRRPTRASSSRRRHSVSQRSRQREGSARASC